MRNAATFDDEFGLDAVPRKGVPRKPRASSAGRKKKVGKPPRFDMHRVARFAAIGMAATMALGIMVNALVLQKGHHPAPLFGSASTPTRVAKQATAPASAASPPARAAMADTSAPATAPAPVTAKAPKAIVATRDADTSTGDDAIGRLISHGPVNAAKAAEKNDGKRNDKTVAGVQRALTKLGFKVPATGLMGSTTKKAIEAFEKDRHMAAKGGVDRRLVKVLAAESGIKID